MLRRKWAHGPNVPLAGEENDTSLHENTQPQSPGHLNTDDSTSNRERSAGSSDPELQCPSPGSDRDLANAESSHLSPKLQLDDNYQEEDGGGRQSTQELSRTRHDSPSDDDMDIGERAQDDGFDLDDLLMQEEDFVREREAKKSGESGQFDAAVRRHVHSDGSPKPTDLEKIDTLRPNSVEMINAEEASLVTEDQDLVNGL